MTDENDTEAAPMAAAPQPPLALEASAGGEASGVPALPEAGPDWRDRLAGGDAELVRELGRYQSPEAVGRALKEAKALIRSGRLRRVRPTEGGEALVEWRQAEGIPARPEDYRLPKALLARMGEADKPALMGFARFAHERNARPEVVEIAAEWYFETLEQAREAEAGRDRADMEAAETALRSAFGRDYRARLAGALRFLGAVPGLGPDWLGARLADGRKLANVPEFIAWAAEQQALLGGDTAFAAGEAGTGRSRKAEIEAVMKTDIERYRAEGLDREYQGILEGEGRRRR